MTYKCIRKSGNKKLIMKSDFHSKLLIFLDIIVSSFKKTLIEDLRTKIDRVKRI